MWSRNARQFVFITIALSICLLITMLYDFTVPEKIHEVPRENEEQYQQVISWKQDDEEEEISNLKLAGFEAMEKVELTEEQLKVLRSFNKPIVKELPAEENSALKKNEDPQNPAKERSDALRDHLHRACETLNITLPLTAFMMAHMHFDHKREAVYCFVPKVACTSWKRIWMKMTGLVPPSKNISEISRYTIHTAIPLLSSQQKDAARILTKYRKFMFVRHPFDRALSAYKDKLENTDKASSYNFHKEIGARIQRKYRLNGGNFTGDDVTFSEFIRFISEPVKGTFEQRNEHWLSIHDICNPCGVKYDFIGKYENLKEDSHYVLDWIGASDLIKEFPVSDRPFHARRYDPKYFGKLSHEDKMAFFRKYIMDFTAFNYSIP